MKTNVECLPCLLRQALQVARLSKGPEDQQVQILQEVSLLLADLDMKKSPPGNAHSIYAKIATITGCEDPYLRKKQLSNENALKLLPGLRKEIQESSEELYLATRFAIAGNIIDYGAFASFDVEAMFEKCRIAPLVVNHFRCFKDAVHRLPQGAKVLYLTDNCGEIVYDSLLVEYLHKRGLELTIAVKDGPIINDALLEDARMAGLDKYGQLITNGGRYPGTELSDCSPEFLEKFDQAEMIISKGQGNFESLSESGRDIFFLLTIKCAVAAEHIAKLSGVDGALLKGAGEMAVYYSGINN